MTDESRDVPIMTTTVTDLDDFKALDPFFRIIE
jgi:hypothetical protein